MYLSFKPKKNQAFRLYLDLSGIQKSATSRDYIDFTTFPATAQISKDGGSFANTTSAPHEITTGKGYVDLTATEMNADAIMITMVKTAHTDSDGSTGATATVIIYTSSDTSSTLDEILAILSRRLKKTNQKI